MYVRLQLVFVMRIALFTDYSAADGGGMKVYMTVAVIGSRDSGIVDAKHIRERIPKSCTKIISGGAPGIDTLAEKAAGEMRIRFESILPDYAKYGHAAPLKRNMEIISSACLVIAFWDFKSRGTAHTITQCIKKGIPVRIYSTSVNDYA